MNLTAGQQLEGYLNYLFLFFFNKFKVNMCISLFDLNLFNRVKQLSSVYKSIKISFNFSIEHQSFNIKVKNIKKVHSQPLKELKDLFLFDVVHG